ncbi:cache domain-containing protein [Paeniglutamicibacter sp. NPDC091659]|uniref:cache domain-containing protein n=1 Tax=Paeniglutamicibacter sp. NPDC091659 TaxID=3364389 RepID=UPI0037F634A3
MTTIKTADNDASSSVVTFFESLMEDLRVWAGGMSSLFEDREHAPSQREVDAVVHPLARKLLNRQDLPLVGAGFVAAFEAVSDVPWHMAWWQGEKQERLLMLTMESAGETYSRREWFTVPMESGAGHITGPYVDFLCTDEYTLTFTVPVKAHGRIVGVAGADIFVESIEGLLVDRLREIDPRATLINGVGRVVVSADPQLAAGRLLIRSWKDAEGSVVPVDGVDLGFTKVHVARCGDLPMAVAVPE